MNRRALIAMTASLLAGGRRARAQATFVPAIIYAVGQKFDRSFNEAAFGGAERFRMATGVAYLEVEPRIPAEFEAAVPALARRGATDIVAVGFYYATPLREIAARHPEIRFTLIDAVLEAPNVQSVTFREHEGAFLAGMLAAMASRSNAIGFVGAIDIPLIRRFVAGFEAGILSVKPDARFVLNFIGTTPEAFSDATRAAELATAQFDRGVDVVFAGGGASNNGVFQRAVERGRLAIAVDINQNGLFPGTILTSQLKRVDVAVETSFAAARAGNWRPGVRSLGLAERGVGLAFDEHNARLVSAEMLARLAAAEADIVAGRLAVPDGVRR
jgi:basic membrane protein A